MHVLVTGARGKVGRATVAALVAAGHRVRGVDLDRPVFERIDPDLPAYYQADLTDAGQAFAVVRGAEAVIHCAALPEPTHNPPQVVFQGNLAMTFNLVEAAVASGVRRFVNLSSETVTGLPFAERPFLPAYLPIDEGHPLAPQDPYALSKVFGEQLMDAAVRRSDLACISIRPSHVQHEGNIEHNLGPQVADPSVPSASFHSYVDLYDLADALVLAVGADLRGHEAFYVAAPDTVGNHPLAELIRRYYDPGIPLRPLPRPDAAAISSAKAQAVLGYTPRRSWSDYLDQEGHLRPDVARGPGGVPAPPGSRTPAAVSGAGTPPGENG